MNKKIIIGVIAVLVAVIIAVAFIYTYTPYLGPSRTLDFTITGSHPEVLYVPMVAKYWEFLDKAEQWNLTIRVLEFSNESEPVAVMIYRYHWRARTFLYPRSFDAAIVGSGYLCNPSENKPEMDLRPLRKNAKHIAYLVMHGTEDRAVPFEPVKEFVEQIQKEGFNVTFKSFEGAGHGNYNSMESIYKWLEQYG